jgi:ATP-dependent Lon protease
MTTAKPLPPLAPGETRAYPVLPLRDLVVFPHMIAPLFVGRKKSILALEEVMRSDTFILVATQKNASDDGPATEAIYEIGTLASVLQLLKLPDGSVKVLVEGAQRAKVVKYTDCSEYYEAEAVALSDTMGELVEAKALARLATTEFESYVKLIKKLPPEVVGVVQQIEDHAKLADTIASHLALKIPDRQAILETTAVTERLEKVIGLMESEISVLQVEKRVRTRVKRQMEKTQREYFLNEQMKAIQNEIGDEEGRDEFAEIEDKIKKTKLSKEAREKATHELKKLRQISPMSPEGAVVRNYLDWLLSIPWNKKSKINNDLVHAQQILDHDHYGVEKVKERIVEYLAVQQRANKLTGPILCLVGPPGVGKTSLGKSIAKATGRDFVRVSLGGVHDEAEIRGHRRTYIGSMPVDAEGQDLESTVPARRGRQDGFRLPRRSVVGAARGARLRAEPHVQRPLPRGRLRSLQRDVHHHGEHAQYPTAADGPHGDHPHRRLHRGRESGDRAQAPDPELDHQARPCRQGMGDRRRGATDHHPPLHARGGRAQPRARALHLDPQGSQGTDLVGEEVDEGLSR